MNQLALLGRTVLAVVAACFLAGCATMFSSGPQSLTITSEPAGATYRYGPFSGKTPDTIEVPRKSLPNFASFDLKGYQSKTVPVDTGIQGATWWDVLFWPGFIVDFSTGNAYKVEIPTVTTQLEPLASAAPAAQAVAPSATPAAAAPGPTGRD